MGTLGFGADDKEAVFRVLAALLHLGNVRFEVWAVGGGRWVTVGTGGTGRTIL